MNSHIKSSLMGEDPREFLSFSVRAKLQNLKSTKTIIIVAPVIMSIFAILEYLWLPNFESAVSTNTYTYFLLILISLWCTACIVGLSIKGISHG